MKPSLLLWVLLQLVRLICCENISTMLTIGPQHLYPLEVRAFVKNKGTIDLSTLLWFAGGCGVC